MANGEQDWNRFLPPYPSGVIAAAPNDLDGQTVCITGAGGSLGSALAKTLASRRPRALVLLDASEQRLFELRRQLQRTHSHVPFEFVLGRVNDDSLLAQLFDRLKPHSVFHAAAFKHVELLEYNLAAAIENNVLGTWTLAAAAARFGVQNFLLVSTDKAVRPHSVMGASKRLAELLTISCSTPYFRASAIRLGNVIGSAGSVLPLFADAIARGEPLYVTHENAERYFLTEDETVAAIMGAGAAAEDGAILIPHLRVPVRIAELAAFMIRHLAKGREVPIVFTGLRPGEKLTEELIGPHETKAQTGKFFTVVRNALPSKEQLGEATNLLAGFVVRRDQASMLDLLRKLVPEYVPSQVIEEAAGAVTATRS